MRRSINIGFTSRIFLLGCVLAFLGHAAFAQHGHPLVGTWSGDWKAADGQTGRVLVVINFDEDQVISGNIIEGTIRSPITDGAQGAPCLGVSSRPCARLWTVGDRYWAGRGRPVTETLRPEFGPTNFTKP